MRLIDADNYKGKVIASHCYSGVNKVIRIDDVPTVDVNNLIIEELEKIKRKLILKLSERFDFGIETALNVIDEELSELKGESNG